MSFSVVRACPHCGKGNRIPAAHLAHSGRCGACKGTLPPQSVPIDVDDEGFGEIVRNSTVPILVDFWAAWCGPCRIAAPEVKELARETAGKAVILKVDTEACPQLAMRFQVQTIPTFIVFHKGNVLSRHAGVSSRGEMRGWLPIA